MNKLACLLGILLLVAAANAQDSKTDHNLPGKAETLDAVERADAALWAYRDTLLQYKDLPAVASTISNDREPILIGGLALVAVKTQLHAKPEKLDGTSLAVSFANVDAAATNASLTAGTAAMDAAVNGPRHRDTQRNLAVAGALIANTQKLKEASDRLWDVLEKYLKVVESCGNQKPIQP